MKGDAMNLQGLTVLSVAVFGAVFFATSSQAADRSPPEGLVAARASNLDQLYVRPNTDLAGYTKAMIDPVQIGFRKDWNQSQQDSKGLTRRLRPDDVRSIADGITSGMQTSIVEAFKARGYEIVAAPGPGVLRLSPSATELYVNAADETPAGMTRFFTKDAGEATLILEAHDAVSGALLARVVDHRSSRQTKGTQIRDLRMTTNVSSGFWLDEMFTRWATACAGALKAARST
jgi:hypothetical protein